VKTFADYTQIALQTLLTAKPRSSAKLLSYGGELKEPGQKLARLYYVSGIVQGVGYRYFARRVAVRLGLSGYAKNLRDGRVEVYAIGSPEQLDAMAEELRRGPAAAEVSEVIGESAGIEEKYSQDFSIQHDTR
jgi:acylphosphatase